MADAAPTPIAIWAGDDVIPVLEAIVADVRVELVGLGGEGPRLREVADGLETPLIDDPRRLASVESARAVVIMDPGRPLDPDALAAVVSAAGDRPILSMTPRPGGPAELLEDGSPLSSLPNLPIPTPLFRWTRHGRSLLAATETFGVPISASVEFSGPPPHGLLATRLLDAFDLLSEWFGMPLAVQAVAPRPLSTPDAGRRRMFVLVTYPDGRTASISVGAEAGVPHRSVALHGAEGCLRMIDGAVDWTSATGEQVEFDPTSPEASPDSATEILEAVESLVPGQATRPPSSAALDLLSACEAAALSVRTGEPETIERVRGLFGRV